MIYDFDAELWVWDARRTETWTFVSVPAGHSAEIREFAAGIPRGFGSVRVEATIGGTTWRTSIFPGAEGRYALPVKKAVRTAESLEIGGPVQVRISILD